MSIDYKSGQPPYFVVIIKNYKPKSDKFDREISKLATTQDDFLCAELNDFVSVARQVYGAGAVSINLFSRAENDPSLNNEHMFETDPSETVYFSPNSIRLSNLEPNDKKKKLYIEGPSKNPVAALLVNGYEASFQIRTAVNRAIRRASIDDLTREEGNWIVMSTNALEKSLKSFQTKIIKAPFVIPKGYESARGFEIDMSDTGYCNKLNSRRA